LTRILFLSNFQVRPVCSGPSYCDPGSRSLLRVPFPSCFPWLLVFLLPARPFYICWDVHGGFFFFPVCNGSKKISFVFAAAQSPSLIVTACVFFFGTFPNGRSGSRFPLGRFRRFCLSLFLRTLGYALFRLVTFPGDDLSPAASPLSYASSAPASPGLPFAPRLPEFPLGCGGAILNRPSVFPQPENSLLATPPLSTPRSRASHLRLRRFWGSCLRPASDKRAFLVFSSPPSFLARAMGVRVGPSFPAPSSELPVTVFAVPSAYSLPLLFFSSPR